MHGGGLQLALVFLLAAVVAVPLFKRFGLGAVLGYLAAGVMLGPDGVRVVRDAGPVLAASEIGVVLMLFVIGLELSLPRLKLMRKSVFGVGGLQVAISGALLGGLAMFRGLSWEAAVVVGLGLAFSSTAVSLQLLSERKKLNTEFGHLAFAILLFQDLAAIPLIAAIPLLGHVASSAAEPIWFMVLKAVGAIAVVIFGGRYLLRWLFRAAARIEVPEMLTATALLAVLGAAWVMQMAGMSMGLGAFLAGVLLADSEFRHEIEAQIEPFKGLLLGLFFMAVGMSIDLDRVVAEPVLIVAGVAVLLVVKFAILFAVGQYPGRLDRAGALRLGSVMALGGEFAFVIFTEADRTGLIDVALHDRLVAIVGLSMALTPLLMIVVGRLIALRAAARPKPEPVYDAIPDEHAAVIIAGFGRFGQIVARLLLAQRIPFVALETDSQQVEFMRRFGNTVYYGDPARPELLRAAGAGHARIFINAIDNTEANLRATRVVRRLYPDLKIFARAHDRRHAWQLMDLGVEVFRETFASGLEMGREVLVALGVPREVAVERARRFREHDERMLASQHLIYDDESALLESARQGREELEQLFEADASATMPDPDAAPGRARNAASATTRDVDGRAR